MSAPISAERLASWFGEQLPGASNVAVTDLSRPADGASAEMILATITWQAAGEERFEDVVLRARPNPPCLIEPYDLAKQFDILRRLEPTDVLSPRALWIEPTGDVIGREFFVMNRLPGSVYEMGPPTGTSPEQVNRMCHSMIEQLAAIHNVDIQTRGLHDIDGGGVEHLSREVAHWRSEIDRVERGRFPALQRLAEALLDLQPPPSERVALVHGDPKPGNIAFTGDTVSGMFDWEMATVGDPLTDVGWIEMTWMPWVYTPGAPTMDVLLTRYEQLTGIPVRNRTWYCALAKFKLAVILLVGGALLGSGHSNDILVSDAAALIHPMTTNALEELGVEEVPESGPVLPDPERVRVIREAR